MWNNTSPAGFVASLNAGGSALVWSTYVMSADHPIYQGATQPFLGVAQLAVTASGDVYIAGLTGPGFSVTASAPEVCFNGLQAPATDTAGLANDAFVARLDTRGVLLDATYVGNGVVFTLGLALAEDGSVLLSWEGGSGSVRSQIQFGGAGWSAPVCLSPAVLNSATLSIAPYYSATPALTPGELIVLTGFGIGPDTGVAYQPDASGEIPLQLAGVEVLFDGRPAPVLYAQSRQINAIAPVELSQGTQTNITVQYNQATVGSATASVVSYGAQGIYRSQPGLSSQAAAINQDGSINGLSNPAPRGSVVSMWGTGLGSLASPCATGRLNPAGPVNMAPGISVDISPATPPGTPATYAPALYAGSAPGMPCGVMQINMRVPTGIPQGVFEFSPWSLMELASGGQSVVEGNIGATIYVK